MIGFVPAVGDLVRCTGGSWMTRPPQSCPHGHRLRPGAMVVGRQPCSRCRGGHTTWRCLDCGGVVYGPPLTAGCRILVGAAEGRGRVPSRLTTQMAPKNGPGGDDDLS